MRSAISVGMPARWPLSTSAFLTQSFSVCGVQPIFAAIEVTACQRDGCWASLSRTSRTARSRTSGENLFVVLLMMLHPTQELEPPANPERFSDADGVSYSFGPKGRPEITLTSAIRDTDYQPWSGVGRAMWDAVRFTNQGTTYEVWTSLDRMAENAGWEGGVNVLKGEELLASPTCAPGSVRGDLGDIFDAKIDAGQCWNFDSFAWQDAPCP
jgi:hypothetical protein